MLKLEIKNSGSAFGEEGSEWADVDKRYEISRLLKKVALEIEYGREEGSIIDINGNKCGTWKLN